jgi:hypothetical protein
MFPFRRDDKVTDALSKHSPLRNAVLNVWATWRTTPKNSAGLNNSLYIVLRLAQRIKSKIYARRNKCRIVYPFL